MACVSIFSSLYDSQTANIVSVEIAGYAARAASYDITDQLPPYVIQYLFILVAPALFAASIYMILGRIIRSVQGKRHSPIRPVWLTRIFVTGDVISFATQLVGGGLQAYKKFNMKIAQNIVLAGLSIQIVIFGVFVTVALVWHRRMKQWPTGLSLADTKNTWERAMYMLYGVSSLIIVRSVFRIIEYGVGRSGYLLKHEWTSYVFDSSLMVMAVFLFSVFYPGYLLFPEGKDSATNGRNVPMESSNGRYV